MPLTDETLLPWGASTSAEGYIGQYKSLTEAVEACRNSAKSSTCSYVHWTVTGPNPADASYGTSPGGRKTSKFPIHPHCEKALLRSASSIDPVKLLALHSTQISNALLAKTSWNSNELIDVLKLARENTLLELINNLLGKSTTLLGGPQ